MNRKHRRRGIIYFSGKACFVELRHFDKHFVENKEISPAGKNFGDFHLNIAKTTLKI